MRRAQAILIILALAAVPLALLARASANSMSCCTTMCCPAHGHHPDAMAMGMICHRDAASAPGHCLCAMHSPLAADLGLFAPMPPTAPIPAAGLVPPDFFRQFVSAGRGLAPLGFSAPPFEPPRA
jgi:hypothetical protein